MKFVKGMIIVDKFQKPRKDIGKISVVTSDSILIEWRQPTTKTTSEYPLKTANALFIEAEEEVCECCLEASKARVGCEECGGLFCPDCMAAMPEDDAEERGEVCEGCF